MKMSNVSKILLGAFTVSALLLSCSKKNAAEDIDPTVDSSKQVTGTIEVSTPSDVTYPDLSFPSDLDDAEDFINSIGSELSGFADSTIDKLNTAIDTLKDSETVNAITDKMNSAIETIQNPETYTNILDNVKDSVSATVDSIKDSETVSNVTNKISEGLGNLGIDQETQDALDSLKALSGKLGF